MVQPYDAPFPACQSRSNRPNILVDTSPWRADRVSAVDKPAVCALENSSRIGTALDPTRIDAGHLGGRSVGGTGAVLHVGGAPLVVAADSRRVVVLRNQRADVRAFPRSRPGSLVFEPRSGPIVGRARWPVALASP